MYDVPLFTIIQSDYYRYKGDPDNWLNFIRLALKDHAFMYSMCLRLLSRKNIFYLPARVGHKLLGAI